MGLNVDIDWGVDTRALKKFNTFIAENYNPLKEQPEYDDSKEVIAQMEDLWYGPISFDDLTAFANALPEDERQWFINTVKGAEI